MERSRVFPSHSCAQVELYFDQSVVSGQPRARVRIVHEYSLILCVSETKSPLLLSQVDVAARDTTGLILHAKCSSGSSV